MGQLSFENKLAMTPRTFSSKASSLKLDDPRFQELLAAIEREEVPQRLLDLALKLQEKIRLAKQD